MSSGPLKIVLNPNPKAAFNLKTTNLDAKYLHINLKRAKNKAAAKHWHCKSKNKSSTWDFT